jgi:SprT protein
MEADRVKNLLEGRLPSGTLSYCLELWLRTPFEFRLRKNRVTKIGDFTASPGKSPRITVNQDLSPYLFLVTYIHEVAHLEAYRRFGSRVVSHGAEWKNLFQQILAPVLNESVFPTDLLEAIQKHMKDPMASTYSDGELMKVFHRYDLKAAARIVLSEIPEGSIFGIRGRWFRKGLTKRTRVLCQELKSKRKYLVPVDAPVENVQLALI